jgi:uncharacterized membrane protein YfcA
VCSSDLLAGLIGAMLGLLGGGGSILMVPMLVYVAKLDPKQAIATSLVVVCATSFAAMLSHARKGYVCWKTGATFGVSGIAGAYLGGRAAVWIPGGLLLLLFALVMLITVFAMLKGRKNDTTESQRNQPVCPLHIPVPAIMLDGLLIGSLTGLIGAGGGFVVVPALALLGNLPMHAAVGTSLFVITLTSLSALAGYTNHVAIDPAFAAAITAVAIAGSLAGGLLSQRCNGNTLRKLFGVCVLAVALYLLHREMTQAMLIELQDLARRHSDFLLGVATVMGVLLVLRVRAWVLTVFPARHERPSL